METILYLIQQSTVFEVLIFEGAFSYGFCVETMDEIMRAVPDAVMVCVEYRET